MNEYICIEYFSFFYIIEFIQLAVEEILLYYHYSLNEKLHFSVFKH